MVLVLSIGIIFINIFYGRSRNLEDDFAEIFRKIDIDGDGFITGDELRTTVSNLGKAIYNFDVKAIIAVADLDGDGKINLNEFQISRDDHINNKMKCY